MIKTEDPTREKILISTLAVFSERGISKTSLNEVAYRAGVTRVTVYRHFEDKKELVRAAFLRVEQVFEKGLADLKRNPHEDGEKILNQIGEGLSALPSGDAFARMDELKRLYPDVYSAVQQVRVSTLSGLFENLFAATKRKGRLKSGLNGQFVRAVFLELAINLFENPRLKAFGLSDAELYLAIKDLFCVGFLGAVEARSKQRPYGH
jgi:AcrR family transcriptional regulator